MLDERERNISRDKERCGEVWLSLYTCPLSVVCKSTAEAIAHEFDLILELTAWQDEVRACAQDHDDAARIVTAVLAFVLRDAASFDRRVMVRMVELDLPVLLFAKRPFHTACKDRGLVAQRVLDETVCRRIATLRQLFDDSFTTTTTSHNTGTSWC